MKAKWIQGLHLCPHCRRELKTRIIITPKKYGYNAEYKKICGRCGEVRSAIERG